MFTLLESSSHNTSDYDGYGLFRVVGFWWRGSSSSSRNSIGANRLCWQQFIIFSQQHSTPQLCSLWPFTAARKKKWKLCLFSSHNGFLLPIQIRIYCICLQKRSSHPLEVAAVLSKSPLLSKLTFFVAAALLELNTKTIRLPPEKKVSWDHFSKLFSSAAF